MGCTLPRESVARAMSVYAPGCPGVRQKCSHKRQTYGTGWPNNGAAATGSSVGAHFHFGYFRLSSPSRAMNAIDRIGRNDLVKSGTRDLRLHLNFCHGQQLNGQSSRCSQKV